MTLVQREVVVCVLLQLLCASGAFALCGDVTGDGQRTAGDALTVLKTAVGQTVALNCSCAECGTSTTSAAALAHCADVNGDGSRTAADALTVLKTAVGQSVALSCACTACQDSTDCPAEDGLDGRTYIEIYTCNESFGGGPLSCPDDKESDSIRFTHGDNGEYEIRDVDDTGFVYHGTLECRTFTWDASSPGQYTETGIWAFSDDLESFSGSSTYTAIDHSYTGDCNITGAESPTVPPNPTPPPGCPEGGPAGPGGPGH